MTDKSAEHKTRLSKSLELDDCARPACDDIRTMFSKALAASSSDSHPSGSPTTNRAMECPPDKATIGHGAWTLLHSMVAWYPDNPTHEDKTKMKNFFDALATFYPCSYCANDFSQNLRKSPVKTESRQELCQWLCEQHNVVNKKLGKKTFSCDMESLDERWRISRDPSCRE